MSDTTGITGLDRLLDDGFPLERLEMVVRYLNDPIHLREVMGSEVMVRFIVWQVMERINKERDAAA